MTIQVGDKIPSISFQYLDGGVKQVSTDSLLAGKKVVLFSVPGAFTPTCSQVHLPGFVEKVDQLKSKGVDEVVCISVNDPFVMKEWEKACQAEGKVKLLSDGNAEFAKAVGLDVDLSAHGMGIRMKRSAFILQNGVVEKLYLEPAGGCDLTSVDHVLKAL